MHRVYLQKLHLENYRNFQVLDIKSNNNPIILIGANGVGKTNILEAISLLSPGRGIRAAKLEDITRLGEKCWTTSVLLQSKVGIAEICSYFTIDNNKRCTEFNGTRIANSELSAFLNILWLTPQMEGIFLASASERRKFLDRIVYNFYNNHASKINKYEYCMQERAKILQHNIIDLQWLQIVEVKMAELSIEIAANRVNVLTYLQTAINELDHAFPKAILAINGAIELQLLSKTPHNMTEYIQYELKARRTQDKLSRRTTFGAHRIDLIVKHAKNNMPAQFCSTGEQKAMLITLLLAQVISVIKYTSVAPLLLLDEIFVHLDYIRKQDVINFLIASELQMWITATDLNGIEALEQDSELVSLT